MSRFLYAALSLLFLSSSLFAKGEVVQESGQRLKEVVSRATKANPNNCSGFLVAFVGEYLGSGVTKSTSDTVLNVYKDLDLRGKLANDQVDYIAKNWKKIDAATAASLADQGRIVVAGIKSAKGHGHVAVVMPGGLEPNSKLPSLGGGAINPIARSETGQPMSKVFRSTVLPNVAFYTPWFTPRPVIVDPEPQVNSADQVASTESITFDDNAPKGGKSAEETSEEMVEVEEASFYADGSPSNDGGWQSFPNKLKVSYAQKMIREQDESNQRAISQGNGYTKYRIKR